jgi:hypothetical protein
MTSRGHGDEELSLSVQKPVRGCQCPPVILHVFEDVKERDEIEWLPGGIAGQFSMEQVAQASLPAERNRLR